MNGNGFGYDSTNDRFGGAYMFQKMGIETSVNFDALLDCAATVKQTIMNISQKDSSIG